MARDELSVGIYFLSKGHVVKDIIEGVAQAHKIPVRAQTLPGGITPGFDFYVAHHSNVSGEELELLHSLKGESFIVGIEGRGQSTSETRRVFHEEFPDCESFQSNLPRILREVYEGVVFHKPLTEAEKWEEYYDQTRFVNPKRR